MNKKIYLVINEDRFFISHRSRIAEKALEEGWDVTLVTKDTGYRSQIEEKGIHYMELPINPTGMNPIDEYKTFKFLKKLYKDNPDSIIHLVGLKNILWGSVAARIKTPKGVVFAVSGLGTLFGEEGSGLVSKCIQKGLKFGMKLDNSAVIFQNHDDEALFEKNHITQKCNKYFIKGSGVDLTEFNDNCDKESDIIKIIFTGRILREKGVEDLIKAAEILRPKYEGKIQFLICGDISKNPKALSKEEILKLTDGNYIKWLGHRNDIPQLLRSSHIMCFPSFYREGVPKSLIEASAAGLPIITTNSVGCRDTVEEGLNGFTVPTHSPEAIADALQILIDDPDLRNKMGKYSRKKAESEYDVDVVADIHLNIYNSLNNRN